MILRPLIPVSSRISEISLILLSFTSSIILSIIAYEVVVGGILVISIQLSNLS